MLDGLNPDLSSAAQDIPIVRVNALNVSGCSTGHDHPVKFKFGFGDGLLSFAVPRRLQKQSAFCRSAPVIGDDVKRATTAKLLHVLVSRGTGADQQLSQAG